MHNHHWIYIALHHSHTISVRSFTSFTYNFRKINPQKDRRVHADRTHLYDWSISLNACVSSSSRASSAPYRAKTPASDLIWPNRSRLIMNYIDGSQVEYVYMRWSNYVFRKSWKGPREGDQQGRLRTNTIQHTLSSFMG